jgi:hypothetical protein
MKFRAVAALALGLGISIPLTAVSLPASAAPGTFTICELNGKFCAGVPTLSSLNLVTETSSGRVVFAMKQVVTFEGHDTYRIKFNANTNLCIGASDGQDVDVQPCTTGIGVVWALVHPGGVSSQDEWINRAATEAQGKDQYLSGHNKSGGFFFLTDLGFDGAFQKFYEKV